MSEMQYYMPMVMPIGAVVKIKVLEDLKGRIIGAYCDGTGVKYLVRYFYNCEAQEVYFYADELMEDECGLI